MIHTRFARTASKLVNIATGRRHKSVEIKRDNDLSNLYANIRSPGFISKCLYTAYPSKTQSQLCQQAARDLGKSEETIRRWVHDASKPSFVDFWPVFVRASKEVSHPDNITDYWIHLN